MAEAAPTTDTVKQAQVAELAVLEAGKKGAGALWVRRGEEPAYRTLDEIEPERFRTVFRKTYREAAARAEAAGERAPVFMVVHENEQLHVVCVPPVDPGGAGSTEEAVPADNTI